MIEPTAYMYQHEETGLVQFRQPDKRMRERRWLEFPLYSLPAGLTPAAEAVLAERRRQVEAEGWTPEHDDEHRRGELTMAASCYAMHTALMFEGYPDAYDATKTPRPWPWDPSWWKPSDPRRNLVKASALILAEIERLDRAHAARAKEKES